MVSDAFVSVLGSVIYTLWLLASVYIYVSLLRQISGRPASLLAESTKSFGLPEAVVAALLVSFLLLNAIAAISAPSTMLSARDLIANLIITVVVLLILLGFLKLRGLDVEALAGLSKIGIVRAIGTGTVLLIFAYPVVGLADAIMQRALGSGSSKQNIVELFNGSHTIEQRILIIILAVAVAPMAEEFVFRFFLYGVVRRYFGRFVGLVFNALLFAAVHAHLPSFVPLFVLAACLTLAYEWTGSILVSMTMHSLFNSVSLILLAFPQLSQR